MAQLARVVQQPSPQAAESQATRSITAVSLAATEHGVEQVGVAAGAADGVGEAVGGAAVGVSVSDGVGGAGDLAGARSGLGRLTITVHGCTVTAIPTTFTRITTKELEAVNCR